MSDTMILVLVVFSFLCGVSFGSDFAKIRLTLEKIRELLGKLR